MLINFVFVTGSTYEKRNGMKEPDHFGDTVSDFLFITTLIFISARKEFEYENEINLNYKFKSL